MGGTDKGDQGGTYYRPRVKTRNWITRIFTHHLLNIGCVNTFIIIQDLYRKIKELQPILPKSQLGYRLKLVDVLAKKYQDDRILPEAPSHPTRGQTKKQWEKDISRLIGAHHSTSEHKDEETRYEGQKRPRFEGSYVRNWFRGRCKLCSKQGTIKCKSCGVFLCIQNTSNDINCWERFHTCRVFPEIHKAGDKASKSKSEEVSDGEVTV